MTELSKSKFLIIFDVDGTLVDAETLDHGSFDHAFTKVTKRTLTDSMWMQFEEVTAQAIVHQALGEEWPELITVKTRIQELFLANLRQGHEQDKSIRAVVGAVAFLQALKESTDFDVAIATGCWRDTAHFKLTTAGFDLTDIPFACASDCYSRAEIISLAAQRAGRPVEEAIYVGDGLWDLRATRQLGIPFIGVGRRIEALRRDGARYTLETFSPESFQRVLKEIREENLRS